MYQIIPKGKDAEEGEWKPSMNLYELIQYIPDFISEVLLQLNTDFMGGAKPMIGKFYLGLQYDYQQIWM